MPRRRRHEPDPPATEAEPPPAPTEPEPRVELVDQSGRADHPGDPEIVARRKLVRQLMVLGVTRNQLVDAMRDQGVILTDAQARRDYSVVLREWSADYEEDRSLSRAAQIARLTSDLARLRRDAATASTQAGVSHAARAGYWRAVEAHENLLARIQGHMAPVKVQVDASLTVRESLVGVIANMSPEELDALAAEQVAVEADAAEARRLR